MKKSQKEGGERNILFSFPTVRRIPSIFVGAILQFFGVKIPYTHCSKKNSKSAIIVIFWKGFSRHPTTI